MGDLDKVRDLVLKANPDVVAELVRGGSIDELLASVAHAYTQAFFTGDTAVDSKAFDGLKKAIPAGQTVTVATNCCTAAHKAP